MCVGTAFLPVLTVLSAVRCMEVTRHEACVSAGGDTVPVTCSGHGERIRVDRVVYSAYKNLSATTGCDVGELELSCEIEEADVFSQGYRKLIRSCYGKKNCSLPFGDAGRFSCARINDRYNHLRMNYSCVQANRLLDLCGNLRRNITTATPLSYFSEFPDIPRDCKCVVTGGYHVVRVISVLLPFERRTCTKISLTITSDMGTTKVWESGQLSIGEDPIKAQSSAIHFVRSCNYGDTIVWIEIIPDPNVSLSLYCGRYATTSSHEEVLDKNTTEHVSPRQSSTTNHKIITDGGNTKGTTQTAINTEQSGETTEKVTIAGATTGETTHHEPSIGVIVGASIGGVVIGAGVVLIFGFVRRRRRREQKQKQLSTSSSPAQPDYEDVTMAPEIDTHSSKRHNPVYENSGEIIFEGQQGYYNVPGRSAEGGVLVGGSSHLYENGEGENKGDYSSLQAMGTIDYQALNTEANSDQDVQADYTSLQLKSQ